MCIYVSVHTLVHVQACFRWCVYGNQRTASTFGAIFKMQSLFSFSFLKNGSVTNLEISQRANLADQWSPCIYLYLFSRVGIINVSYQACVSTKKMMCVYMCFGIKLKSSCFQGKCFLDWANYTPSSCLHLLMNKLFNDNRNLTVAKSRLI